MKSGLLLRRIRVDPARSGERSKNLPFLSRGPVEIELRSPLTLLVGENGSGKNTLLEAVAANCAIRPRRRPQLHRDRGRARGHRDLGRGGSELWRSPAKRTFSPCRPVSHSCRLHIIANMIDKSALLFLSPLQRNMPFRTSFDRYKKAKPVVIRQEMLA